MIIQQQCSFELPDWVDTFLVSWQQPLATINQRMELAVALSAENVKRQTGGPFAAIVVEEENGNLISVGVNMVTHAGLSVVHAEIVALSLAQAAIGNWDLSVAGQLQLVSSCEPCAMCFGAVPWSGVKSMICGASKRDAEAAGFDEGDKPEDWVASFERRGISVRNGVLSEPAAQVLNHYRLSGGTIYNTV